MDWVLGGINLQKVCLRIDLCMRRNLSSNIARQEAVGRGNEEAVEASGI